MYIYINDYITEFSEHSLKYLNLKALKCFLSMKIRIFVRKKWQNNPKNIRLMLNIQKHLYSRTLFWEPMISHEIHLPESLFR